MKKSIIFTALCSGLMLLASCDGNKTEKSEAQSDTLKTEVADSTVYGRCGKGSMMNTLELVTDEGNTLSFTIDEEQGSDVQGGMMAGDRMAVTFYKSGDENIAHKVVNLTTLLGRWTALDKDFTIHEDGSVESSIEAESKPYTAWAICNAKLILNTDTFDVLTLGADSLELESSKGIFVYKRQK
ncbi:MAG: hypothetical protein Q4E68_12185 [Prevotellaceae bacterium]|nr:hypothetical protein [Prevotellaceae bacterium]